MSLVDEIETVATFEEAPLKLAAQMETTEPLKPEATKAGPSAEDGPVFTGPVDEPVKAKKRSLPSDEQPEGDAPAKRPRMSAINDASKRFIASAARFPVAVCSFVKGFIHKPQKNEGDKVEQDGTEDSDATGED